MIVTIEIPGIPQQQGSKEPWGAETNEKNLKAWRSLVAEKANAQLNGMPPIMGAVEVHAIFTFPRPKSHYRTGKFATTMREDAPLYHTNAPDLDKLCRAIGDALRGTVILDDRQIAQWFARKVYGSPAGAEIVVGQLPPHAHA